MYIWESSVYRKISVAKITKFGEVLFVKEDKIFPVKDLSFLEYCMRLAPIPYNHYTADSVNLQ